MKREKLDHYAAIDYGSQQLRDVLEEIHANLVALAADVEKLRMHHSQHFDMLLKMKDRVAALEAKQGEGKDAAGAGPAVSRVAVGDPETPASPRPFRAGDRVVRGAKYRLPGDGPGEVVEVLDGGYRVKWDRFPNSDSYISSECVSPAPPQAPAFIRDLSAELTQALSERDEARRENEALRQRIGVVERWAENMREGLRTVRALHIENPSALSGEGERGEGAR